METRFFGPSAVVQLIADTVKEPIHANDLVLVKLDNLVINKLLSQDLTRQREGTLAITINDQVTTLSWAAREGIKIYNLNKFQNQLLFWGTADNLLEIDIQFIETDRNLGPQLFDFIAQSLKVIPGMGNLLSVGASLVGSIINAIHKQDDDSELEFYGSMGNVGSTNGLVAGWLNGLSTGSFEVRRKIPNETQPQVQIPFSIFKITPPPKPPKRRVLVLLEQIIIRTDQDKDYRTLLIETAIGSGRKTQKNSFSIKMQNISKSPELFLGFQYRMLYNDLWDSGLPFQFSMAFLRKNEMDAVQSIIESGGETARYLFGDTAKERTEINQITKAAQSLRSLVMEFLPDKISIGTIHGIMLDSATVANTPLNQEIYGEMLKIVNVNKDQWTPIDIHLQSEEGGEASIRLKIKEIVDEQLLA